MSAKATMRRLGRSVAVVLVTMRLNAYVAIDHIERACIDPFDIAKSETSGAYDTDILHVYTVNVPQHNVNGKIPIARCRRTWSSILNKVLEHTIFSEN